MYKHAKLGLYLRVVAGRRQLQVRCVAHTAHLCAHWRAFGDLFTRTNKPHFPTLQDAMKRMFPRFMNRSNSQDVLVTQFLIFVPRFSLLNSRSLPFSESKFTHRGCALLFKQRSPECFNQPRLAYTVRAIKYYKSMATSAPQVINKKACLICPLSRLARRCRGVQK